MSDMIERVGRAIFRASFHPDEDEKLVNQKWDEWPESRRENRRKAMAAIEAMREPTEAMLERGPPEPYMDAQVWNRMIDAELEGE